MRMLKQSDICRGTDKVGKKKDLRGWTIEFFGELSKLEIEVLRHMADKLKLKDSTFIQPWSDTAPIRKQVTVFNETIEELDLFNRNKKFKVYKYKKNGSMVKNPTLVVKADDVEEADKIFQKSFPDVDEYEIYEV